MVFFILFKLRVEVDDFRTVNDRRLRADPKPASYAFARDSSVTFESARS